MQLSERLRHGLASAVLTAAALTVPSADAASSQQPLLAQSQGQAGGAATSRQAPGTTKPASPKPATPAKGKAASGKGAAAGGCGAHDGGCGPSR